MKKRFVNLIVVIFALLLVTACTAMNDNEDEPQTEPIEENTPSEQLEDMDAPTQNEMNENFGKEIEGNEADIPENYLEKDEDTESSSSSSP